MIINKKKIHKQIGKFLKNYLYKSIENHYVMMEDRENLLIFHIKNIGFLGKKYLLIKHRSTGKRISKRIKNKKVKISKNEISILEKISTKKTEIFDVYIKTSLFNNQFLKRTKIIPQNKGIKLLNKKKKVGFISYSTKRSNLSFLLIKSWLCHEIDKIRINGTCVYIEGKIFPFQDSLLDEVELCLRNIETQEKKRFKCNYTVLNNGHIHFNLEIKFNEENIVSSNWSLNIRLKYDGIITAHSNINTNFLQNSGKCENLSLKNSKITLDGVNSAKNHGKIYDIGNKLILKIRD